MYWKYIILVQVHIHILHLRVVKYTKEKNEMNVEARKKETLKFAILLVHWQVCMAAKNLGYKR